MKLKIKSCIDNNFYDLQLDNLLYFQKFNDKHYDYQINKHIHIVNYQNHDYFSLMLYKIAYYVFDEYIETYLLSKKKSYIEIHTLNNVIKKYYYNKNKFFKINYIIKVSVNGEYNTSFVF